MPAGTVGTSAAGFSTSVPLDGFATPTGASLSATGCGGAVLLCPTSTAQKPATAMATVAETRERFEFIAVPPVLVFLAPEVSHIGRAAKEAFDLAKSLLDDPDAVAD